MIRRFSFFFTMLLMVTGWMSPTIMQAQVFKAGVAKVDITPTGLPIITNGGFLERSATKVTDPLHARALVLDDGASRIALCVVDTCMMMRETVDEAKEVAHRATGIPVDKMLVSATHTHTAPSAMGCLGVDAVPEYQKFLVGKVSEALIRAAGQMKEAKAGWITVPAWSFTNCRRWIRRSDKMITDPFGLVSVRANMHPGYANPDVVGPSGPTDPDLSLLSIQTADGHPLALFANFSMHYFGSVQISADYCGQFAEGIGRLIGAGADTAFVGIMSQGTSGDSQWMDYSQPKKPIVLKEYSEGLMRLAAEAYGKITYESVVPLAMAETKVTIQRRVADEARLAWAKKLNAAMGDRKPANMTEVYAREQLLIKATPERELKLQALRIGKLGITALPNEVYAITGLKLKAQSPLANTFNIELANGADGYIPPPEQHKLGGYTTWAARTAGLVPEAEPRIVETVLTLLEQVAGAKRKPLRDEQGPYATAVLSAKPLAYWRLNEINPPIARDATGQGHVARYEDGIAMYLPGAQSKADAISDVPENPSAFSGPQINRAPHLAGGRIRAELPSLGRDYSIEGWFWNGLAPEIRAVTGYIFSRGAEGDNSAAGDHLGVGGTLGGPAMAGRLFFYNGNQKKTRLDGRTMLGLRTWHHVVLTRRGQRVEVYLDGRLEIAGEADWTLPVGVPAVFLGGRGDHVANFEGKLDEVAVYDRVLTAKDVGEHYAAANRSPSAPAKISMSGAVPVQPGFAVDAPLSPSDSLKKLRLPPGYRAEIAVAEPMVMDPVAFDWDTRGRLWVVEMADYPLGMDGKGKPGGRVRILEDTDGDGRYDKSTLFAEGLNFPNGILTWRDGCIVTAAPDILFLRDTDGDGIADKKEVLITGILEGNQQLRANGLRWGLDNWVHVAAGSHNGKRYGVDVKLRSTRLGQEVFIGSRDFRFKPDTGVLEPQSGPTQFGGNCDNWGHWFGSQNAHPLWHYALPDQYLRRNPHYGVEDTRVQMLTPASSPPVYPASKEPKRYHDFGSIGHYTSACGGMICRDKNVMGEEMTALVCEPVHNLIQRLKVSAAGSSYAAQTVLTEGQFDFFANEDRWCRPVMVREGPDGALWVADMYRYMIEHPQFLPAAGKEELMPHYRLGDDRGRIYRVSRVGVVPAKIISLDKLSTPELVARLGAEQSWVRDKAHQLLLWRADSEAIASLKEVVASSANPHQRVHALSVLAGLGGLSSESLAKALGDPHPRVRECALRWAETSFSPAVLKAALALERDPDAQVRLQLAFSLGESSSPMAGAALGRLLTVHADDSLLVSAVMTSATPHLRALVTATAARPVDEITSALLSISLGQGDREALAILVKPILEKQGTRYAPEQLARFGQLKDLLGQRKGSLEKLRSSEPNDTLGRLLAQAPALLDEARVVMNDGQAEPLARITAAVVLGGETDRRLEVLVRLLAWLEPQYAPAVQAAAIQALAGLGGVEVPSAWAKAWPKMSPATQQLALAAWVRTEPWAFDLVRRLESKEIPRAALDATQRSRLLKHDSKRIRGLAETVFAGLASSRAAVLESYQPVLKLTGDIERGRLVFTQACSACHARGAEGRDLGPNLLTVIEHPPEKLLGSILDPSADIQPGYTAYTCTLASGEQLYGLLATETANSIVMKLTDGTKRTVLRNQIVSLQSQSLSLMPEGLEAGINHQQMADLIAYLRSAVPAGR